MMGFEQFQDLVELFVHDYCLAHFTLDHVDYDARADGRCRANILLNDMKDKRWIVPVIPAPDGESAIVIDLGDAGHLKATDSGLYAYLWNRAALD